MSSNTADSSSSLLQALGHPLSDRRLQVLRALGECGSISQAARAVGVSYKAAWQAIDTLSNLACPGCKSPWAARVAAGPD